MAKLSTVNIIVFENGDFQRINSFTEDEGGNLQAEELFKKEIMLFDCPECDVESFIEDGYFSHNGNTVYISHSE